MRFNTHLKLPERNSLTKTAAAPGCVCESAH